MRVGYRLDASSCPLGRIDQCEFPARIASPARSAWFATLRHRLRFTAAPEVSSKHA